MTVQKNYRLHDEEACSTEDDDDHDEKRVVAGQACPMALRGILLHHLPVLKKRVESEPRSFLASMSDDFARGSSIATLGPSD